MRKWVETTRDSGALSASDRSNSAAGGVTNCSGVMCSQAESRVRPVRVWIRVPLKYRRQRATSALIFSRLSTLSAGSSRRVDSKSRSVMSWPFSTWPFARGFFGLLIWTWIRNALHRFLKMALVLADPGRASP